MNSFHSNADTPIVLSRRKAIASAISIGAGLLGCNALDVPTAAPRLTARPRQPTKQPTSGLNDLRLDSSRPALLYVPPSYNNARPAPFALLFHGAGGAADGLINVFRAQADALGLLLLSCKSDGLTWDGIHGKFGVDVEFVNRALDAAFDQCNVDPSRLTIAGFSDGATYVIGLGLANGDLFPRVAAFSAGGLLTVKEVGKPRFYMSHGTQDNVIPIGVGRGIAFALQSEGYDAVLWEFEGGHTVPQQVVVDASTFMTS